MELSMTRAATSVLTSLLALSACLLVTALASPASALSCNRRLVLEGDPASQVRALCGEPTQIARRTESRTRYVSARGRGGGVGEAITVTTEIEVWTYDFGPRRFIEEITIENGVVRSIRAGGYGTAAGGRRTAIDRDVRSPERAIFRRERAPAIDPIA
jgi:hypothetical protein